MSDNGLSPATRELFPDDVPAPHFPRVVLTTTIEFEGYTFVATFNDMGIVEATSVLKKRGCTPVAQSAVKAAPAAQAAGDAPVCPIHAPRRMKESNFGGWFCTWSDTKTGDKCKEKVK